MENKRKIFYKLLTMKMFIFQNFPGPIPIFQTYILNIYFIRAFQVFQDLYKSFYYMISKYVNLFQGAVNSTLLNRELSTTCFIITIVNTTYQMQNKDNK